MAFANLTAAEETATKTAVVITESDLVFYCPSCAGELVVDREGAGMEVDCPHCGKRLVIPEASASPPAPSTRGDSPAVSPPAPSIALPHFDFTGQSAEQLRARQGELTHQLKENQSQDTEMRGHINRATIELHRLQLKLKKLQERKVAIAAELAAARDAGAVAS